MFWVVLAAQISAPEPKQVWFSNDDTPTSKLSNRGFSIVGLRLTVSPDGHLQDCAIERSSGNSVVDNYTCDLTRRRASFRPARAPNGSPTYGVLRIPIIWAFSMTYVRPDIVKLSSDLTLSADRLSHGKKREMVSLAFEADTIGHPLSCAGFDPFNQGQDSDLVARGCSALLKQFLAIPAKDQAGQAVASIQTAHVLFETK